MLYALHTNLYAALNVMIHEKSNKHHYNNNTQKAALAILPLTT